MRRRLGVAIAAGAALLAGAMAMLASGSGSKPLPARELLPALSLNGSDIPSRGFGGACGVAVDTQGDIFVTDPELGAIDVFGPKGEYRGYVTNPNRPCGVAVDTKGALYVLQASDGNVVKYAPGDYPFEGVPPYGAAETIDAAGNARGIAVDPFDNRLFVAAGGRIDVYKANGVLGQNAAQRVLLQSYSGGTFRLSFRGQATRPLPYDATQGEVRAALAALATIGRGNVLVRAGTNGPRDHFVTFTGALGAREVPLLGIDASGLEGGLGEPLVTERLVKGFSGHLGEGALHEAGSLGVYTYDGANRGVTGLLAESPGLVSDPIPAAGEATRLVDFGGEGAARGAGFRLVNHIPRIYHGSTHYVFAADSSGKVTILAGHGIADLAPIARTGAPIAAAGPHGGRALLGVDPSDGHFFLYDAERSAIEEYEATGAYVGQIADPSFSGAPGAIGVVGSDRPHAGALYVAAGAAGVLAFGPPRAPRRQPLPDLSIAQPEACGSAVDSHGDVYLSGEDEIRIFDPQGEELQKIADPHDPCSLAVDSEGNLYASQKASESGSEREVVVFKPGSYPPQGSGGFAAPRRIASFELWPGWIAVDPANDRLFVNTGELAIEEYGSAREGSRLIDGHFGKGLIHDLESYNGGLGVCGKNGDVYSSGRGYGGQWRIFVIESTGTRMLTRIDGSSSPQGPFEGHGVALAVDQSDCHVLIAALHRPVQEFEPSGSFVGEFGPETTFLGGDLAVDNGASSPNRGDVYVAGFEGLAGYGPLSKDP
jgi:hypothetical protein